MAGEEALQLLETSPPSEEEAAAAKAVCVADATACASHSSFDGWTTAELAVSTG